LITLPVSAAAISRSVWRHRKAGICRMSDGFGGDGALFRGVNVGQQRQTGGFTDLIKHLKRR
jgi:hypothetical protein